MAWISCVAKCALTRCPHSEPRGLDPARKARGRIGDVGQETLRLLHFVGVVVDQELTHAVLLVRLVVDVLDRICAA